MADPEESKLHVSSSSLIDVTQFDGWAEVRLNRADKRNAISRALADAAIDALDSLNRSGVPVVVLSAAGPVFSAGADIREGLTGDAPSARLIEYLKDCPMMLVCKMAQPAYGAGVSLVAACPVVFCADDAFFVLPEAKHGIFPVDLLRDLVPFIPRRKLVDIALTGSVLSAKEASAYGLVSRVCTAEDLEREVEEWVELVRRSPALIAQARSFFAARQVL